MTGGGGGFCGSGAGGGGVGSDMRSGCDDRAHRRAATPPCSDRATGAKHTDGTASSAIATILAEQAIAVLLPQDQGDAGEKGCRPSEV